MSETSARWRPWPVLFGLAVCAAVYLLLAGAQAAGTLSAQGRLVASVGALMASWWMTEAIPIEATGLLPLALFPLLSALPMKQAAPPYADQIIFLFLGGMLLGRAMERWGLHRRFALATIAVLGGSPARLVGAFLLATAFVSMWISNTAATIVMLPIGASVAGMTPALSAGASGRAKGAKSDLGSAIVLAIAFGASIGGVGTLIGTPPIAQFAGFINRRAAEGHGSPVTFLSWLRLGLPTLALVLPITWLVLTRVAFRIPSQDVPGIREEIGAERSAMGKMSLPERLVLTVFVAAAVCWVLSQTLGIDDTAIAIGAAMALFLIPAPGSGGERRALLTWREAESVPWGILLLFGGGLSLAEAIRTTGVDAFIARGADGLTGVPLLPLMWVIALVTIVLTEFTSNTALVAAGLPVAQAIAERLNVPAAAVLATMTLTASLGFMLPAGTAPNALVFASGHVSMRQMMRAGVWLDAACAFAVPLLVLGAMRLGILPGV